MNALAVLPFRRYLLGQGLSALGDALVPVALAFAVLRDGGAGAVGAVLLAGRLPAVLLALVGGVLGDRVDRRSVLLVTDLVRCLLQATTAGLLLSGSASLTALVVLQALAGAAGALFVPAAAGLVRALVLLELLAGANAMLSVARSLVAVGGLAAGGALVAVVGPGWAFAVDAVTYAASAALLARLPRLPPPDAPAEPPWRAALLGLRETVRRRWLWTSIAYVAGLNLVAICPFLVLGPVVAARDLGGATAWGLIGAGYAAGATAGSALVLRLHPRHPLRTAFLAALALVPFLALLAVAAPVPVLVAASTAAGAQAAVFNVLHGTVLQTCVPERLVSRVASVNLVGTLAAVPLGLALAGPLADATSPRTVLVAAAVLVVAGTGAVLLVRDVRELTPA